MFKWVKMLVDVRGNKLIGKRSYFFEGMSY